MRRMAIVLFTLAAAAGCDGDPTLGAEDLVDAGTRRLCAVGEARCVDGKLRTCLEDGTGWLVEACPAASVCRDAACVPLACEPGARECVEGGVRRCAADGSGWSAPAPCGEAQTCIEGVCLDRACAPGETACADKMLLTCADDGLHWDRTPCDAGERCIDGECRAAPEDGPPCPAGEVLCGPEGIFACAEDGRSWVETPCPEGQACFRGRCVACIRDADCGDDRVCADGECAPPPLTVATDELPPAQVGRAYRAALEAAHGAPPLRWRLVDGALPAGLALGEDGVIEGVPEAEGEADFRVAVDDELGGHAEADLRLVVLPPGLVIATDADLPPAEEGSEYALTFEAMGGTPPYGWILVDGALPAGLSLGAGGVLSGTPSEVEPFDFRMRVVDAGDPPDFAEKDFHLEVEIAPLRITGDQSFDLFITRIVVLPTITVIPNVPIPYETRLTARGGLRPHHWREQPVAPELQRFLPQSGIPDGLTLDDDGRLHGAVVDPSQIIELEVPFTQIRLTGFFFVAEVSDSQDPPDTDQAIFLLPTLPIGG